MKRFLGCFLMMCFLLSSTNAFADMVGYEGQTTSGEDCKVYVNTITSYYWGPMTSIFHLHASVTPKIKYIVDTVSETKMENFKKTAYVLTESTADRLDAVHGVYEAGVKLPDSNQMWICTGLRKTDENRPNPYDRTGAGWGL